MLNLSIKWISFSVSMELAVKDACLLVLEDGMIVKHSECPMLSWKKLHLFLLNRNSDSSLGFTYHTLLSYRLGIGSRITCLKIFMLPPLWVSLGSPRSFWCGGVVGPKPFATAQHVLNTHHKIAVKTENTAFLQIGGLWWYPSESNLTLRFYFGFIDDYLWVVLGLSVIIYCVYQFWES